MREFAGERATKISLPGIFPENDGPGTEETDDPERKEQNPTPGAPPGCRTLLHDNFEHLCLRTVEVFPGTEKDDELWIYTKP